MECSLNQGLEVDVGMKRQVYMVHYNGSATFVKEYDFFKLQGGFEWPWGEDWIPVVATSIEEAREKGFQLFVGRNNPYYLTHTKV